MEKIKVDESLVLHVADLARIAISQKEVKGYQENFQEILDYVGMLEEVDVKGVEPLYNPVVELMDKEENYERKDEVKKSLGASQVISNAPDQKNNEFKIKSVMEE